MSGPRESGAAGLHFVVDRQDLRRTRFVPAVVPERGELGRNEVLLEIDRVGFSANNITYATLGEAMRYWQFFPGPDGWGRVPVWGFARVADSASDEIQLGERVFGYLPMSTHVVLLCARAGAAGFVDGAPHRADLPAVYQRYTRLPAGEGGDRSSEDQDALWRPLFMTSFGAADFLADRDLFGAGAVVISSASSKTAIGIAFMLARHTPAGFAVVGLTSRGNVSFCSSLGYYERVLAYDELHELPGQEWLVFVDLAGSERMLGELRRRAGDRLRRTVVVGATHWEQREPGVPLSGGGEDFFFLPPWMEQRRREWGPGEFARRYDEAWRSFLPTVETWMRVVHHRGSAGG